MQFDESSGEQPWQFHTDLYWGICYTLSLRLSQDCPAKMDDVHAMIIWTVKGVGKAYAQIRREVRLVIASVQPRTM